MTDEHDQIGPLEPVADAEVTDVDAVAVTPVTTAPRRRPFGGLRRTGSGIGAIGVKELRGRMRGRRAFVILSLYLVLLGGFTWMVELIMERSYSTGFGGGSAFATAAIGQGIFAALLMLETLLVVFLAPMSTAGAISLEREKQTLEMLAATPITSAAIVFGKLVSALVYVWLLIAASIPLTAVVFVFGGVAPEDLVRGYLVLIVTALGFGSFGLFCSSIVKRTQAATAITIFGVLALSIGTLFVIVFWQALSTPDVAIGQPGVVSASAPGPIAYLNPFLAQAEITPTDALCSSENALRYYCRFRDTFVLNQNGVIVVNGLDNSGGGVIINKGGVVAPGVAVPVPAPQVNLGGGGSGVFVPDPVTVPGADVVQFNAPADTLWTKTVVGWLILSVVFLLLSVQFVSPTRRWRLRRGPALAEETA